MVPQVSPSRTRQEVLLLPEDGLESLKMVLATASRALWFNNRRLANRLLASSRVARDLFFVEKGLV